MVSPDCRCRNTETRNPDSLSALAVSIHSLNDASETLKIKKPAVPDVQLISKNELNSIKECINPGPDIYFRRIVAPAYTVIFLWRTL